MSTITQNGGIIYIQQSGNNIQYQSNSTSGAWTTFSSWPITFVNSNPVSGNILTISLTTNLSISNITVGTGTNGYFITGSSYIIYDGTGKTVTIDTVTAYLGLIKNGTSGANGYSNVTVKNINSEILGISILSNGAGWICQAFFGNGVSNILIDNCSNSGTVNGQGSGGICGTFTGNNGNIIISNSYNTGSINTINSGGISGRFTASNYGIVTITNCYNTAIISSLETGGICGSSACDPNGTLNINNCYNTGTVSTNNTAGICGNYAGSNYGTLNITNCYNTGNINGDNAAGFCSIYTGSSYGIVNITNCYNTGNITRNNASGIFSSFAGFNNGSVTITNCYNTGIIGGNFTGGICGPNTGQNNGSITIINCFNSGSINNNFCGGIVGRNFGINSNNLCKIENCYNIGNINGSNAGGITGPNIGYNNSITYTPQIEINKSYSLGNIATSCGGIIGGSDGSTYTNIPVIYITNCYSAYNTIVDSGSQYISTNLPTSVRNAIILTNVYNTFISSWSDSSANSLLTGVPTNLYSNNPGITWTTVGTNTPYLLSSYNAPLYSPSTVNNISTGGYVSSAGLFTSDYTYNLISVNDALPSTDITINNTTGVLTFANLATATYTEKVLCSKGTSPLYYGYNFNTFILNQTSPIPDIPITQNGGIIYIRQFGNDIQYQRNSTSGAWTNVGGWPITFINSNPVPGNILTVIITTPITISTTTVGIISLYGYFITGSSYITYDGTGKTITIDNINNYLGFIRNGTDLINGYSNITAQNILLTTINSTLVFRGGWICHSFFGNSSFNTLISNCHVDAPIGPNQQCGGICGRGFGQGNGTPNSSSALIIGCSKAGLNNSISGGGITSIKTGQLGGFVKITDCYNIGTINVNNFGGICGVQAGQDSGKVEIINCYNTAPISSNYTGGICGGNAGYTNGTISILNCYNTGDISSNYTGGICGPYAGYNSNNLCSIVNCYNTGNITGINCGGITGAEVGLNNNLSYTPKILIQNCYSLGNIGTSCGGICGGTGGDVYTNIPIINITNCYSAYNSIVDTDSQYISTNLQTTVRNAIILTNVYSTFISTWSDISANNLLIRTQNIYVNSILYKYYSNYGEIWYSNQNNTPFNLTSYLDLVPRRKRID